MANYYQPEVETMPYDQLRQLQDERLVKQVQHVWDNVPYYRAKMEEKGVTPAELEAMTDKDSFDELERELTAFIGLYEKVWKQTKRKIRKDLLNPKYIKGESGKK